MKQSIYLLVILLAEGVLFAQSPQPTTTENYITTTTLKEAGTSSGTDLSSLTKEKKTVVIQYFDGLGRPKQAVSWQASPLGKDIIQPIEYDELGREAKKYLPYVGSTSNGSYIDDFSSDQISQYSSCGTANSNAAYSLTVFDGSPLNRVMEQGAPGEVWQPESSEDATTNSGHTIRMSYQTNADGEVRYIEVVNDTWVSNSSYPANELYKTVTKDENWTSTQTYPKLHTTEEFKNKQGQVILKRSYVEDGNDDGTDIDVLDTYYVYDDYGLLRFVLPPEAVNQAIKGAPSPTQSNYQVIDGDENISSFANNIDAYVITPGGTLTFANGFSYTAEAGRELEISTGSAFYVNPSLIYSYKYDGRKRMIEKTIPGAETVYMVYDTRDRLVATQDGEMREKRQWMFTKYDVFNRPIATGTFISSATRSALQSYVDGFYVNNASRKFYESRGTDVHGYTNQSFPSNPNENDYLTITYYDDYDWFGNEETYFNDLVDMFDSHGFSNVTVPSITRFDKVRGQVTGTKTKVLDDNNTWLESVTFYDERYRPILTQSKNYVGGEDIVLTKYKYDFTAEVEETWQCHTENLTPMGKRIIRQVNSYDHAGRLLTTQQQMTGDLTLVTITDNTYDELGQLVNKKVGNAIQQMDYKYNIRGWLTQINNPSVISTGNRKFSLSLSYNTTPTSIGGERQYNGNISAMVWRTPEKAGVSPSIFQNYAFTYDALNRLKSAQYSQGEYGFGGNNGDYNVSIDGYDLNGNILGLTRQKGSNGQIDNLSYSYAGNQLLSVSDVATGTQNLGFNDGNKTAIDYNYDLNGNMITDKNKGLESVEYNHLNLPKELTGDDGKKIKYIYTANGQKLRKIYYGSSTVTTNYAANFVYEGSSLKYILHGEGKYVFTYASSNYQFDLKDHLGNVRVVVDENGNEVQQTAYYPFGMTMEQWSSTDNKYLYNSKELQDDNIGNGQSLDWYDYGRRMYDPAIGRFHVQDRFAEKYLSLTPYQYGANNPIYFIDANGDSIVSITRKDNQILVENSPTEEGGENFTNTINLTGRSVKQGDISDKSASVVNDAMVAAGDNEVDITSGKRTAKHQARIMYNNLEGTGKGKGVDAQKKLYGTNGDKVIDAYVGVKSRDMFGRAEPGDIKQIMENKIVQLGPGSVSKHCSNDANLNVFDVDPASVSGLKSFQTTLSNDSRVSKIIKYPKDPGVHIVIKL